MESIYELTEYEKLHLYLLQRERERLLGEIRKIDQEICQIYEKAPIKYKLDFDIPEDRQIIDKFGYVNLGVDINPNAVVKIVTGADK